MAILEWEGLTAWRIAVCAEEMAAYGSVVVVCTAGGSCIEEHSATPQSLAA